MKNDVLKVLHYFNITNYNNKFCFILFFSVFFMCFIIIIVIIIKSRIIIVYASKQNNWKKEKKKTDHGHECDFVVIMRVLSKLMNE